MSTRSAAQIDAMSAREIAHAVFIEGDTQGEAMHRMLERLQAQAPVFHFPEGDVWIATGNAAVREILRSPSAEVGFAARNDHTQPGWRDHHSRTIMGEWMGHQDGPEHRRMRGGVNGFFMPAMAEAADAQLRPAIGAVVRAFKDKGGGDFLAEVGYGVTARVTDYLLGLSGTGHPDFRAPIERMMKTFDFNLTAEEWRRADDAASLLWTFWSERVGERIANPEGDDVLAQLIRSGLFNERELALIAENVLTAASDTTANTSTNALHALLSNPDQLALARSNPAARANLAEEAMRTVSAAPSSGRLVVRDMSVAGQTIPAGAVVLTILSAANRDPSIYPDPHRFDLLRDPSSKAVGFGIGAHICLGQWFAKKVLAILFDELFAQCATIEFDGTPPEPRGIGMRQLPELCVRVS